MSDKQLPPSPPPPETPPKDPPGRYRCGPGDGAEAAFEEGRALAANDEARRTGTSLRLLKLRRTALELLAKAIPNKKLAAAVERDKAKDAEPGDDDDKALIDKK